MARQYLVGGVLLNPVLGQLSEDLPQGGGPSESSSGASDFLEALYRQHAASVFRVAYRLTGSTADAEDVVQEVFLGLPKALCKYQEQGRLDAWIRKVAARVALTKIRRRDRMGEIPLESVSEPSSERDESPVDRVDIQRALTQMPDTLRSVFVLKELEGYTHAEIGEMLGIRPGASKMRLYRASELLRRLLRDLR